MQRYRITTLTTITPWTKTFESKEEFHEWLKSMDIADGWIPRGYAYQAKVWNRWITIQGVDLKTHRAEEYDDGNAAENVRPATALGATEDLARHARSRRVRGGLMGTGRPEDQNLPIPNDEPYVQDLMQKDLMLDLQNSDDPDLDVVLEALSASIEARRQLGHQRYGVPGLQPHNGRDMLRDAFEEILDAAVYTKALACENEGDFDDTYAALMTEALYLQAAILDREARDAATEAPAESEADPVH